MKNKLILLVSPILLIMFCSFSSIKEPQNFEISDFTIGNISNELMVNGAKEKKKWDEVRIIKKKAILKVFDFVITKYKQPIPEDEKKKVLADKMNSIIEYYTI